MTHRLLRLLSSIAIGACLGAPAWAQHSAPPLVYQPKGAAKAAPVLLLPPWIPSRAITLGMPSDAERDQIRGQSPRAEPPFTTNPANNAAIKSRRVAIGYARDVPRSSGVAALADLVWHDVDGDRIAAQLRITSPTAAALRIAVALDNAPPALQLRFAGAAGSAVFGPYSSAQVHAEPVYWSPVLDGESAIVEIEMPRGVPLDRATLTISMVSHLEIAGADLKQQDPLQRIGQAGSCEMDVACVSDTLRQQAATAVNAVARMVLVDHGITYLCSGTLVNDTVSSATPYFFTANHCIDNGDADPAASRGSPAATAATVNTYWFFQTSTCGQDIASAVNFVQLAGGAKLVGRSNDYDWAILRLNDMPPAGVTFSAWNTAPSIPAATAVVGIHHPLGDLKKLSLGATRGYGAPAQQSHGSYVEVQWSQGVTEGGSSGSGLFVLNAATNYYELYGGLWGGGSACSPVSARTDLDYYSRLDAAFPYVAPALAPDVASPEQVLVVEFYDAALDDYFITTSVAEIADLDAGFHAGWVRTGLTFLAYSNPATAPSDAQPVCRFYVLPEVGDSHFYSVDANECASTAERFSGSWVLESDAVFYIQIPDAATGACPADTRPVFRFLRNANQLHHRYTAEMDVRDSTIRDGGWIQEGFGPAPRQSVMCSPVS